MNTRIFESDRNRPEGPRLDPGPAAPLIEAMQEQLKGYLKNGLDPLAVGELVLESIRNETFYILTHKHWNHMLEERFRTILEQDDPVGVPPPAE